ncbi:predicted protein [Uncinocarpus reesii 1704]|uniref:Csf1 N-terminal domain-containing protein n=1 Tax=Uncinocarpus reesii (strain UAMH 1704) TaxID=336963 RepID=C4JVD6_UNCRE|nr:uncharacterized protein UREG_06528 [Uncinocarpus reesii 1704]EEP81663.1 predicted protein [Uncinocarpus reesii 1704]
MSSASRLPNIAEGKLTAQPLDAVPQFNWVFLIELIVCGILAYTWHYYRIYIDIHALQISLLGGRIFFKGVRYHGENETILIHSGYITWRYWLRLVRDSELVQGQTPLPHAASPPKSDTTQEDQVKSPEGKESANGNTKEQNQLPCRIEITLHGVEWFVYNRSAAYDTILAGFQPSGRTNPSKVKQEAGADKDATRTAAKEAKGSGIEVSSKPGVNSSQNESLAKHDTLASEPDSVDDASASSKLPTYLSLLPIWINCYKGALVVGNEHVKTLLTTTFEKGHGRIDAGDSGALDVYKQIFEFELVHPTVQFKPNPDFKSSQLAAAKTHSNADIDNVTQSRRRHFRWAFQLRKRKLWYSLRDLVPYFQKSVESFQVHHKGATASRSMNLPETLPAESHWTGLTRYLDEESRNEHEGWNAVEYGRFSTLLDCPSLMLRYHWDIPGKVSARRIDPASSVRRMTNNINGAEPPEWGMHLAVRGGMINYGPWADRERANLQAIIFPNSYRDSQPSAPLEIGEWRQSTLFDFTITFEEETNLRIPTREPSKDWIWKNRTDATKPKNRKQNEHPRGKEADKGNHGPDIRPFGWLALGIEAGSKFEYRMGMFATPTGYGNQLVLDLQGSRVTSSVNHAVLWHSGPQRISCDLSNPLEWNTLHTWSFTIHSNNLELFFLRDHIFLLTDLVNDWTSGPFSEFYTFVPFQYNAHLSFTNVKLFLNVNDSNIINNPTDIEDNSFLIIESETLTSNVCIPTTNYKPKRNAIPFDLRLAGTTMKFSVPSWNTHRTFLEQSSLASLDNFEMSGNYSYNTLTSPTLTDILTLDLLGNSLEIYIYGFLVDTFLKVKENYFGENIHFKTLEEFQEIASSDKTSVSNSVTNKSNDLDVILHIHAEDCTVLLPSNIYDRLHCVAIEAASLDADARFTNYYMDLQTSFSPLAASLRAFDKSTSRPELFIDGLSVYGHRLFGLPPTEPTYVCNWDFDVGRVIGECSTDFIKYFKSALRSFAYSIDDEENSLPPLKPIELHDVVLLRAKVDSIQLWVILDTTALLFSSDAMDFNFNDWAGVKFSERLDLSLPDITLAIVDGSSPRWLDSAHPVRTYACFHTSVKLKMVERKANFLANRELQQQHVQKHDSRTQRTPWLLLKDEKGWTEKYVNRDQPNRAAMPVPFMPPPLQGPRDLTSDIMTLTSDFCGQLPSATKRENLTCSTHGSLGQNRPDIYPSAADQLPRTASRNTVMLPDKDSDTNRSRRPTSQFSLEGASRPFPTKDYAPKTATSRKGLSSAWMVPNFRFHRLVLDRSDLPALPFLGNYHEQGTQGKDELELILDDQDANATHTYWLLDLISGISGFCHVETVSAIAGLLESLQPVHPIEVIDDIQSTVVSDILGHAKHLANPKRVMNLNLRLPACRVRFINSTAIEESEISAVRDQFDLEVVRARIMLSKKSEIRNDAVKPKQTGLTTHLTATVISLSALTEGLENPGAHKLCHLRTQDLVLWSVTEKAARSRVQTQETLNF